MKPTEERADLMADYASRIDECAFGEYGMEWWEDGMVRRSYVADFETTTDLNDCRVWAAGVCEVGSGFAFEYGNSMEWFIGWCAEHAQCNVYFHNLEFDGAFVMDWLERNGWTWVEDRDKAGERCYTTVISDANQVYCIELFFTHLYRVKIYNSLKIVPLSVAAMAKAYGLEIRKGGIDYDEYRAPGHELTEEEVAYLRNDVEIVARVLDRFLERGLNKMTAGSNALHDFYDKTGGLAGFRRSFSLLDDEEDAFIRQAYRGGFTYCDPRHAGERVGAGCVYDANSMYPSVMRDEEMPYGRPIKFDGKPMEIRGYPLWVAQVTCAFRLRDGRLPCIQLKGNFRFGQTEYLSDSGGLVTFTVTNVDWALIREQYHVYSLTWHGGYAFKSSSFRFRKYVDYWMGEKEEATREGNSGRRQIAKLMLNSLYGKFATRKEVRTRRPMLVDDVLRYVDVEPRTRKPVYLPVGVFTTSYARARTVRAAQANYGRFLYADTDSVHLLGTEPPDGIEVDDVKLGAWKHECDFTEAKFLRQKCYMEHEVGKDAPTVHVSGMPKSCHKDVTLDNFEIGATYDGKLYTRRVPGGIVLVEDKMTIREK